MKRIQIAGQPLLIKDYYCAPDGESCFPKEDGKLWLYVNLTDLCPCTCPFCVNPCRKSGDNSFSVSVFQETLLRIREHICGVSFTGGEPMLFPELLDDTVQTTYDIMGPDVEIDLV